MADLASPLRGEAGGCGNVEEGISTIPVASGGDTAEELYSVFSKSERRWIVFTVSFAAMFSGLSSFIYYPAITPLSKSLKVSIELINLTVTAYMIVAGVAPSVTGDMADQTGRRPAYILAFAIYFASNLGLALQKSYSALFVLRMLQSAGSSGTFAIAFGVISDVAPPAERGSRVGILMGLWVSQLFNSMLIG
jgi:MFS family permease